MNGLQTATTSIGNLGIKTMPIIISEMNIKKVENGFLINCYGLGIFIFLNIGDATDFIMANIGQEIKQ